MIFPSFCDKSGVGEEFIKKKINYEINGGIIFGDFYDNGNYNGIGKF